MKNKVHLIKIMFSGLVFALTFASCQKEDIVNENETVSTELQEAPFTNYMVVMASGDMTARVESFQELNAEVVQSLPQIGVAVVRSQDINFPKTALKSRNVVSVIPDYEIKWIPSGNDRGLEYPALEEAAGDAVGSTAYFFTNNYLWGMEAIEAPQAWAKGYTGKGASVFVLDSGIDAEHPDLMGNLNTELSESFVFNKEGEKENWNVRPGSYFNHGSHVAGTIAATGAVGVIGVAPHAELVAVKVLSEYTGSGALSAINAGIIYAADNGADIINMSLGSTINKNGWLIDADGNQFHIPAKYIADLILAQQRAVDYAYKKGVTIIASAGNDPVNFDGNMADVKLPGGLNNVITISATAPEGYTLFENVNFDVPASYTTYGRSLVDLAAPGGDYDVLDSEGNINVRDFVLSASPGGWRWSVGTSMAAPHASGVAALIIAKNGGEMDPHEVLKQLTKSADQVGGNGQTLYFGKGRINANRAVSE